MHRLFLRRQLVRGLFHEHCPQPRRFHVERVAVVAELPAHVLPRHLHVHPHLHAARAFLQTQHAIDAPARGRRPHLVAVDLDLQPGGHGKWHGPRGGLF